jgi:alpha-glucosidase
MLFTQAIPADNYTACEGYSVTNIFQAAHTFQADLDLIGAGCAVYGPDITHLKLTVEYQTESRLHILIQDRAGIRYQVPEEVVPRPGISTAVPEQDRRLAFAYSKSPFAFQVTRISTGEVLFDTSGSNLIFEPQFLRVKTRLPPNPNLYGLGEHIDSFRLADHDYVRTLWARDSDGVPYGENLYGSHPVYFEHRTTGTHGVLLLNSNGMDIKLRREDGNKNSVEFITIGGVLDFYILAGPTPIDVSQQYAAVVGAPAMVPYWSLGVCTPSSYPTDYRY